MLRVYEVDKNNPAGRMNLYFTEEQDFQSFLDMLWKPCKVSSDYYRIKTMMYRGTHTSNLEYVIRLLKERYHKIWLYDGTYLFTTYLCVDEFPDLLGAFFDMAGAQRILDGVAVGLGFKKVPGDEEIELRNRMDD